MSTISDLFANIIVLPKDRTTFIVATGYKQKFLMFLYIFYFVESSQGREVQSLHVDSRMSSSRVVNPLLCRGRSKRY